jgi:hypothetical protein
MGEVRWVRLPNAVREDYNNFGSGGDDSSKPGMGVQFKDLTPQIVGAITRFMKHRQPEFYEP